MLPEFSARSSLGRSSGVLTSCSKIPESPGEWARDRQESVPRVLACRSPFQVLPRLYKECKTNPLIPYPCKLWPSPLPLGEMATGLTGTYVLDPQPSLNQ